MKKKKEKKILQRQVNYRIVRGGGAGVAER